MWKHLSTCVRHATPLNGRIIRMVVGEGGRSTGVLLYEGFYNIGVNHPAIVWEIPHFGVFPAFPHFSENVPHFCLYFQKQISGKSL